MEFADIAFILKYLKSEKNGSHNDTTIAATRWIQTILESNKTLRTTIENYLQSKNHHILLNDFRIVRDIIFRYHNSYILHNINRQQFLSHTLSRRDDRTVDYYVNWFACFLCESHPTWMNYKELLQQWTQCFVHDSDMFKKIITQIDMLIDLWAKVAMDDKEHLSFFIKYMVTQCFQQGKNKY